MTILTILQSPHSALRTVCEPVVNFDDELKQLADDMLETMKAGQGIGLAACQVDRCIRLIVAHVDGRTLQLVNPEIINRRGQQRSIEGCLSVDKQFWGKSVVRSSYVEIAYQDLAGNHCKLRANKKMAACLQHEIDHLVGIMYLDRVYNLNAMAKS